MVREAPEIAEQWRMSEFDATHDLEMMPDEVGQSQDLMAAIDRAFDRAAKHKKDFAG